MLPDSSCLSQFCGIAIRHHIDLAFFLNATALGPCVGIPIFGSAFRRHAAQVTLRSGAPDFSYGVAEWELFVRGAVATRLTSPEVALRSFDRVELHFANHAPQFPELRPLLERLPDLRARLANGEYDVLDDDFARRFAAVAQAIEARRRAA